MARFYVDMPLAVDSKVELPADVVRHVNVLRIKSTEQITIFNNTGFDYVCKILELDKRNALVYITDMHQVANESNVAITLYMAIIANDKFDLVIQKAVELGVQKIVPLYCQNTQRFAADKVTSKIEHWRKIIIAASEQSGRSILPIIEMPQKFNDAIIHDSSELRYILSPHHAGEFKSCLCTSVSLVIGPEGGLTDDEILLASNNRFISVLLGKRILRAETAAISSLSIIQNLYGDFC